MKISTKEEMTQLGLYGLIPFAISAAGAWLSPWLVSSSMRYDLGEITLIYAAVVVSYIAGVGASGVLSKDKDAGLLAPMVAALVAWVTAWPPGSFLITLPDFLRYLIMIGVFGYLYVRDSRAVAAGELPEWYGALRTRLTFWVSILLALIVARELI